MDADLADWLETALGHRPGDGDLYIHALTHPSTGAAENYQRLEFLGDRVLGLAIAEWLYERYPGEPEGKLNRRLATLVSRKVCAAIGRDIDLAAHIRLGKQAASDGATESDNVLGDIIEALIGALFRDAGFSVARKAVRALWAAHVGEMEGVPVHPKSELQEWAAARDTAMPVYRIVSESGPRHDPRFTVEAAIDGRGKAKAEGSSKQAAETAAARTLLEKLRRD